MEITRRTFLKISGATAVGTWIGGLGFCGNKDQGSLHCFHGEGDEAHRIDLCDKCHQYIKTIDFRKIEESDPVLEDLATLHLDVLATQKGNKRPVPNP